jgi:hypothetical protein
MHRKTCAAICIIFMMAFPRIAFGWGARAHSVIDRTAVDALPDDGPVFLKKYVDYIAGSASIPDGFASSSRS